MSVFEALTELGEEHTDTHVRVPLAHWADGASIANDAGFTYFCFLSGVDWLPNPQLDGEHEYDLSRAAAEPAEIITDPEIRVAGGTSRFSVMVVLQNVVARTGVTLTADVGDDFHIPTLTGIYAGANWHERETWEMFGFIFDGHPRLRHIYLPDEFVGFPLRKDFALPARLVRPWPGLVDMEEMPPAEDESEPSKDPA